MAGINVQPEDLVYRYTAFPNLHALSTVSTESGISELPARSSLELPQGVGKEVIIIAWALLLRGYVGSSAGENVVFKVDEEDVNVDFSKNTVEVVRTVESAVDDARAYSAMYLQTLPKRPAPQVYLIADLCSCNLSIVASPLLIPASHMRILSSQLFHILSHHPSYPAVKISPFSSNATEEGSFVQSHALTPTSSRCQSLLSLPDEEQSALVSGRLSALNPFPIKIAGPELLHKLLNFSNFSEKQALDFLLADGKTRIKLSYEQLDALSTQFAHKLSAHLSAAHGALSVPVLLPQSPALYITLIAILKIGAAFVPLNLDTPIERVKFVVGDVSAVVMVTEASFLEEFSWDGCPTTILFDGSDLIVKESTSTLATPLPLRINSKGPAYIMYTSGSTGTPKGVIVSHSAATQSLLAHDIHIPSFERFLQFAAPTFDVFVFEMFFPLFRGKTLVGCDRGRLLADLPKAINFLEIDGAELTPTVAGGLLGQRSKVPGLKVLLTIGEMLTRQVVEEFGDGVLQGMYGPTEAAIHCTLATGFRTNWKVGDVGVPLATVSAYILAPGPEVEVLPIGWVGELVIGGHQLADGYINRSELTKEVFIETTEYGRLYRTGDKARILPSGRIECLGRLVSGQVKLRGQRLELGEVEEVVLKAPGVKGAIASVVKERLVIYVGGGIRKTEVLDVCKSWLPGFMVPSDVVVFDELPRLPSGKADRKRLDKEYLENSYTTNIKEDLSGVESKVSDAVEELLGTRPPKAGSLVAVGLDSIRSIRLVSMLKSSGLKIEVVDVLKVDCIEGIATLLDSKSHHEVSEPSTANFVHKYLANVSAAGKSKLPQSLWSDIQDIISCTQVQESMLAETVKNSKAYCNWILLQIPLSFGNEVVEAAFRTLIERNEILRTGFIALDHGFGQVIWKTSRKDQFTVRSSVQKEWAISSIEEMMEPPFTAELTRDAYKIDLTIKAHHAVYDGWSWEQIMADFKTLLAGGQVPIARPQFRKMVEHEIGRSQFPKETTREFWLKTLEDMERTKLPSFYGHSDVVPDIFTEELVLQTSRENLEYVARNKGVSPQVISQVAWAYLLGSYVGSSDVVFGTVVSGRTIALEGVEDIIGPTILTLPVRVDVEKERRLEDVMREVHKSNRNLLEHTDLSLREVKKACMAEGPLFDSLIVWQQTMNSVVEPHGDGIVRQVDSRDRLEVSLLIEVEPGVNNIKLRITYQNAIFPEHQARLLLQQLDQLIHGITANPDSTLDSLLNGLEKNILSIENPSPVMPSITSTPSLADLVERAVEKSPASIAVEFAKDIVDGVVDSVKLTFAQLNEGANRLAHHMISLGVIPGSLVCVCMEKSPILYTAILAIVKAGAGYLPLTPETPKDRMRQILENADVKFCLTNSQLRGVLEIPMSVKVLEVDTAYFGIFPVKNPTVKRDPDGLAYAVFTSGSTGVPKGVLITNSGIVHNVLALKDIYPTAPSSRMLQFCSVAFDVSVFEIFFTWAMGMRLCSGTKDTLLRDIQGAINAFGITHLSLTPTVAALVDPQNVPGVQFLVTAGEAVTNKVFNDWAGHGLYQGYGPSETVNICTVRKRVQKHDHINNIGVPFANTSAFVVSERDEDFKILPRGGVGELCFGGAQVGFGYLKMPELTSRKFITHPVYGRIYRSGDIGRLLPDGSIEFVGRQDDQVKIRGHRIELGEINSVLLRSNSVIDTASLPIRRDVSDSYQLVSFVVLSSRQAANFSILTSENEVHEVIQELFQTAKSFLPPYMVPTVIIPVSRIPETAQGKTDKRALRCAFLEADNTMLEFFTETSSKDQDGQEWSETERQVAKIIADVVGEKFDKIGRNTSIFQLGFDSISVIPLSLRIKQAGFSRPEVSQIMRHPTVAALAATLKKNHAEKAPEDTTCKSNLDGVSKAVWATVFEQIPYSEDQVLKIMPCTPLQEAMLSQKVGVDSRTYYNHTVVQLKADPVRLREAWNMMVDRNEIMRTIFSVTSHPRHAYAQVVLKETSLPWISYDVGDSDDLSELIEKHILTVSDAMDTKIPPYAFGLFNSSSQSTLVMSFHHSLYDGFAMDLLLDDVRRAYLGLEVPIRRPFDPVLEYMEKIDVHEADNFWKEMLTGLEPSSFPDLTGRALAFKSDLIGMSSRSAISSRSFSDIDEGCRNLSISLLTLGQASWARLLSVYSGESDLCFGNVVSGRTVPVEGVEDIIAPCFNTVPLRIKITSGSTNLSIMNNLQSINAEILPFQLTPLRMIMGALQTEGQRLFDTLFILQHAGHSSLDELWEITEDRGEMDFSAVVELVPNRARNELGLVLHFRRDVVLEQHAEVLLRQLDSAILSNLDNPEALTTDYNTFDYTLLSSANGQPLILSDAGPGLLHSEFERNARENPSRIALEFLEENGDAWCWTFEQLNEIANRIAHYLISLDLKRDESIPLCIEKSPLYYICILAILKAGAAFTPIDPSLPLQRRNFMIQELGAKVVLVNYVTGEGLSLPAGVEAINIENEDYWWSYPITNPEVKDLTPNHLAYRLYTSGSTGQPKAVSVEIKSAVQTFRASKPIIPWNPDSRILQFAAITFDMCYYDCFMAWSYGFALCSAAKSHLLGDLEGTIKRLRISLLDLTPTVASTLQAENLPDVELLYCIGEAMSQKLVNDWGHRCVNSYGPTEAAMCCTITSVQRKVKSTNIGKPFPSASFFILSREAANIVPVYGSGELCIGGPQVAREYHNNPELTESRFISFGEDIVYRTGDLVRMLADGTFEFIGRVDDQVKIRGLRVELDEINTVLRESHVDIRDAATIVMKHSADAKDQLVTFLALQDCKQHGTPAKVLETDPQIELILIASRDVAKEKLPRYMIPGITIVVDHIPLSAAGKIDKRSLGMLFSEQDIQSFGKATGDEDDAVWGEDEQKIREIFSQVSQVPVNQISRFSTIYEIGLDSISAAQVAMQLKRAGLGISALDILERPSIDQLSGLVSNKSPAEDDEDSQTEKMFAEFNGQFMQTICEENGFKTEKISGIYPCTPAQEGMLTQFLRSDGKLYFNHTVWKLPQSTDLGLLRDSWDHVFESEDILRSGFAEIDHSQHSFAILVHQPNAIELPWTVVEEMAETDLLLEKQKQTSTRKALTNLALPPWGVSIFRNPGGGIWMMFSAHHAIYDAQSLQHIIDDVQAFYSGKSTAKRPKFVKVLSKILKHSTDSTIIAEDREFWLNQLQGSNVSKFPNLCPVRVKAVTSHVISIESSWATSEIENKCQKLGISVHSATQAAWTRVLSAYMGEDAVTIGTVLSGRTGVTAAEDVVFPCLATIPALSSLSGNNHEFVLATQEGNARALKHQHTPLRSIQWWFEHPENSFFDSIFVYQKTSSSLREATALSWEIVQENASVDYSISMEVEPTDTGSLFFRATCRDNIIPPEQTKILLQQFNAALIDILEEPKNMVKDFSGFPTALISCTPAMENEIPTDVYLLHKFVEKYRELTPNKVAFEFAISIDEHGVTKETWTYAALDEEGNKIANFLLQQGVKTGDIVAVCFEKCPEASFAMLGILKAGCAFLALDYNAPIDRKAFIIEDSGARCVLTMDKYLDEFSGRVEVGVFSAQNDTAIKSASTETPYIPDLTPTNLSYCLYTSGTTGNPKGCELTHENAVQAMLAFQRLFSPHWDPESRFLQFASFHFDVSVLEQYWSWSVGICVTSAPRDLIFQDLALTIRQLKITHLDLTPSLAALIRPEDAPSLCRGVFITGGEQLKQEILDTWGETGAIYNGYGPTEVTIGCTMYPRVPANGKPSNIGPQFDNVGSFVLAKGTDNPVLRGAIGELCVSGKLVGRGYLKRPDLTEEKFPTLEAYNERIYRTGDLVRILHDGTFDFAGRADDQVKLRGQRLEIGEINETIKQADERVKAVATLVSRHPKQQKDQLVSFLVMDTSFTLNASTSVVLDGEEQWDVISAAVSACKRKLPVYMVPTHFLPLSAMPLSINNKVDNKKLTAIYGETSLEVLQKLARREDDQNGSWTETEQQIRKILAEATEIPVLEIKRSSTVFELGLDSVSVVGLARRLKKNGFVASSVSLIMQHPSVSQLATALSQNSGNASDDYGKSEMMRQQLSAFASKNSFEVCERLGLELEQIEFIAPCSALQEGMIARYLDSDKPIYYNSFSMLLHDSTDVSALCAAWSSVVRSTDILRTCFCETYDGYAQVVLRDHEIQWKEMSIGGGEIDHIIASEMNKHIQGNRELHRPPIYILLLRSSTKIYLVLNIFHALYDGNSLPLILSDVKKAYYSEYQPRACQFHDVLGHILSVDLESAQRFWKDALSGCQPSQFPPMFKTLPNDEQIAQLRLKITGEKLEQACQKLSCTPQSILQVAWASVLAAVLGSRVTFGMVVSGRSLALENIEGTIGPLFNTIPCSLDIGGASSWRDLIKQAHRSYSESIPYHHTPLRLIHKWLRISSAQPLFDSLFVYQKDLEDEKKLPSLWELSSSSAVADFPLSLEAMQSQDGILTFSIVSKGSVSTKEFSMELLNTMEQQLGKILSGPENTPSIAQFSSPNADVSSSLEEFQFDGLSSEFKWGPMATAMRTTIATLANVDEVSIAEDSSIFELGLDSIEAIKLSSRLRKHDMKLPVSTIMRNPTIRKMLACLSDPSKQSNGTSENKNLLFMFDQEVRQCLKAKGWYSKLDNIAAIYPTTPLQEAMVAETLASNYSLYFNHDVLELENWVDIYRLRKAWETVIAQNEILRTSFFSVADIGMNSPHAYGQIVYKSVILHWSEVDIPQGENAMTRIEQIMKKASAEVDMLKDPPLLLTVVRTNVEVYLVLSISHALYDGWSMSLLQEDVQHAYSGPLQTRPPCRLIMENIFNTNPDDSRKFWKQYLAGSNISSIPVIPGSQEGASIQTYRSEKQSDLSFSKIQYYCKKMGATVQSLGQTCWGLLLAHLLGEPDVLFGTILSGREFDKAQDIMFPSMNTIPVRSVAYGSYKDMVRYIQDNSANALKYQHAPLRQIQKLAGTSGQRLFDSLFIYQRGRDSETPVKSLWHSVYGSADVEYNVCVEMERVGDKIFWRAACKSTIMNASASEDLLQKLDSLLSHMLSHPDHQSITYTEHGVLIGNLQPIKRAEQASQAILNGSRIDLGEIGSVFVQSSDAISDSAALVIEENSRKFLVVFVAGNKDVGSSHEERSGLIPSLSKFARQNLPYWSLPSFIIPTDTIPRKDGEVGRSELRAQFSLLSSDARSEFSTEHQDRNTAWTPLEVTFRRVLSNVSKLPEEEIERSQTIFHLGLDSISAIRVSSELRKESIFLSVAQILREATIERMAVAAKTIDKTTKETAVDIEAVLEKRLAEVEWGTIVEGIPEETVEKILPATSGQVYMLSAWKNSNYTLFMPTFTFRSRRMEVSKIFSAWQSLVRQESILRTTFRVTTNSKAPALQVILRNPPVQYEWTQTSSSNNESMMRFLVSQEQQKPVDLSLPPVRLSVLNSPTETLLFLTIHHALYDGVSLPLLLERFKAFLDTPTGRLPTPELTGPQFSEVVAFSHSRDLQKQQDFWSGYLKGFQSTLTPIRRPGATASGRTEMFKQGVLGDVKILETKCRSHGVTLQAVFLAAYAKVYAHYVNASQGPVRPSEDVIFGIYLSNRQLPVEELSSIAAPTLNIVPLRVRTVNKPLIQLAQDVQKDLVAIGDVDNAVAGLWQIEEWTGMQVDCFFNFLKLPGQEDVVNGNGGVVLEEVKVDIQKESPPVESGEYITTNRFMENTETNLDIEVAVRGNMVDVGVFSSLRYLDETEASNTIEWLCELVQAALEE